MPIQALIATAWLSLRLRSWTPLILIVTAIACSLFMTIAGKQLIRRARPPTIGLSRAFPHLADDLKSVSTTPNLSYITPNRCNDGHDGPYVDGLPGGLESADAWLRQHVPAILDSPAYKKDGMLVITFDETEGNTAGPSGLLPGGRAGGKIGALVLSPFAKGGTTTDTPYNPYSCPPASKTRFPSPTSATRGPRTETLRPRRPQQQGLTLDAQACRT